MIIEELKVNLKHHKSIILDLRDSKSLKAYIHKLKTDLPKSSLESNFFTWRYKFNDLTVEIFENLMNASISFYISELKSNIFFIKLKDSNEYIDLNNYLPILKTIYPKTIINDDYTSKLLESTHQTYRNIYIDKSTSIFMMFNNDTDNLSKLIVDIN